MPSSTSLPRVALLAVPEATASTLYGMLDLFCSAGRDWSMIECGQPGPGAFDVQVVSRNARPFAAANGVTIRPDADLRSTPSPDIVCIPEVLIAPDDEVIESYGPECEWLLNSHAAGATLASVCSGALLLAQAGLLDNREATTHWAYCEALARRFPKVHVQPQSALVVTGDEQRLVMAGGGTSWQDLALYLVARWMGMDEAIKLARIYLVDWHQSGQLPYAVLTRTRQVSDGVIARVQEWIAMHYPTPQPVTAMVEHSGLSERTFKRRFRKATGMTPMAYVHTLRLEEAKQMLESGNHSVDAVAQEVGYEDAAYFSRLFHRQVGLSPGHYRRRFQGLRAALAQHGHLPDPPAANGNHPLLR
ncbi:helix-turn-helix domain-containing protein [Wenzhouxiangella sp. XN201]|uniref:GlxA family transcriptional regulator n=1 Tax=Wenzhouxiangella sp. XN201 TaxID=2710755 RepID=UPI0013C6F0F9|nr:helix-turn-helix domain-containing protein [Wenzhouxiangella sp. XN201]NEZ04193.1 helix-turn-helix domain-containing protein [Wenzhouxiangella sp. XN201]